MTFTASNGLTVELGAGVPLRVVGPGWSSRLLEAEEVALREFFQHERDEELGRWRWPENPDVVVYPGGDGEAVVVLDEEAAKSWWVEREVAPSWADDTARRAALAYFEAHPAPKPWHDAKVNEAWELTVNGDTGPFVTRLTPSGAVHFVAGNGSEFVAESSDITAGRRIYTPEVTS